MTTWRSSRRARIWSAKAPKRLTFSCWRSGAKLRPDPAARVQHARPRRLRQGRKLDHAVSRHGGLPRGVVQIEQPRRGWLVDRVHPPLGRHRLAPRVILVGDAFPPRQAGGRHLIVQHHRGVGQIVEQRLQPLVEERQPMLHPLMLAPGADRLVQRIVRPGGAELDPVVLPEPGDRRLVEDHLGHRRKFDRLQLFDGPLRLGVEPARAVQHVAEEIQPHRPPRPRRIDVDDPAAQGIVARLGHGGDAAKTPSATGTAAAAPRPPGRPPVRVNDAARITSRAGSCWVAAFSVVSSTNGAARPCRQRGERRHPRAPKSRGWARRGHRAGNPRPAKSSTTASGARTASAARIASIRLSSRATWMTGLHARRLAREKPRVEAFGRAAKKDRGLVQHAASPIPAGAGVNRRQ